MKKFYRKHQDLLTVVILLFVWRIYFLVIQMMQGIVPERVGYLGILREANFDGIYYLNLSASAYHGLDQAFFPLFPLLINQLSRIFLFQPITSALLVVSISFFIAFYSLCKLIKLDPKSGNYIWGLLFFLFSPASFFFGVIYTEGLFLSLVLLSFYCARKQYFFIASLLAGFASATRIVGIFLLPALLFELYNQRNAKNPPKKYSYFFLLLVPVGLFTYMGYLWYKYGDPLLFVHIQPAFGAGRSGGTMILLPQVIFRYVKIISTIGTDNLTFWISCLELVTLFFGALILYLAYKKGIRKSYILFSASVLLFPTLSGTLSSLPRYALSAFAIFIFLGSLKSKVLKILLIVLGVILESILAVLFLQGYFVS